MNANVRKSAWAVMIGVSLFLLPISHAETELWQEKEGGKSLSTQAQEFNNLFSGLASTLSPAVVNIFTKSQLPTRTRINDPQELFQFFFGQPGLPPQMMPQQREAQSLGSGFVINSNGIIITNSHVVRIQDRNADQVRVKFLGESETSNGHEAEILGVDPSTDVAVLKLKDPSKVRAVAPFGDSSKMKVGEWVLAIGNPFGHTHTVTQGIVSALGRSSAGLDIRAEFIQTDASINPGNSGGPLFNLAGEVIGINTAIDARGPGIGFAIPINTAKNVIKQLVEKGEVSRGWIGIVGSNLSPQVSERLKLKESSGAIIQSVTIGGPADKAKLQAYDVIREINGKKINTMRDLFIAVGNMNPGEKAKVDYIRNGRTRTTTLVIEDFPSEAQVASNRRSAPQRGSTRGTSRSAQRVGLSLGDITNNARREFHIPQEVKGVLITEVIRNSVADRAGLRPGDVIREIDQKPVTNAKQAEQMIARAKQGLLLRVQSGESSVILSLEFD